LLLQVQGIIAEYERATIVERCRRGKQHAARQGQVSVLASAPYGYRYVSKAESGGEARYDILLEEARVVRQIFHWVARDRWSLREVCRRLQQQGIPTRTGNSRWHERTVGYILNNPAYRGQAGYGKSRVVPRRPQLRPRRGKPSVPRRAYSVTSAAAQALSIAVPPLVSEEVFAAVAEQLAENRHRVRARRGQARHLLQGLLVCRHGSYALSGMRRRHTTAAGQEQSYGYYRCGGVQRRNDDGTKVCRGSALPAEQLEEAVWEDVWALLREPARIQQEYERRLQGETTEGDGGEFESLARRVARVKRTISRLIDSYSDGLLEKDEFEPRLRAARERLGRLEGEAKSQADEAGRQAELRWVVGKFQEFAEQIQSGLEKADWTTRQEILRALVKQIEVGDEDIHIVYRIPPVPFNEDAGEEVLQDCAKGCVP
jgi:site-specific DNA recombinase